MRYFMEAEGDAPAGGSAASAPLNPAAAPAATLPPDLQALVSSPDAFKARLAEERSTAERALYKALGVKGADDIKTALGELKTLRDAQLSEQERANKAIAELTPKAQRAEALEQSLRSYLANEEAAIPDDKRGLLDLAPSADSPEARLSWIAAAKAKGLFSAAAAPVAAIAEQRPAKPATTMAPSGPNVTTTAAKTPYQQYQDILASGNRILAAQFRQQHAKAIEATQPK